ncbi:TrbC/VirB2 family protein [Lysobacter sp. N42]|jgi:type IV secretion system protein VirB2|uniref:TrbC/VirB2 family protein n=1 Tax=Lysobacter sp. N42 TaxID=2545719 RepID=UPI001050BC1A|nr:TrbC/VirB2 family protein [Lysobacter sp. N42]TCZ87236.1 type VI secretion protein [Lysobacter sp. N42]
MTPSRTRTPRSLLAALALLALVALPGLAFAQSGLEGTDNDVRDFFRNINSLLNIASVAVVTIAVIFAGYQIAFAHKRISDVAPVLIGGFMIGAAAQIANMLIGDGDETNPISVVVQLLPMYA